MPLVSHTPSHGGDALAQQRPPAHEPDTHTSDEEHAPPVETRAPGETKHAPLALHTPVVQAPEQQWPPAQTPEAHEGDDTHMSPAERRHAPLASHANDAQGSEPAQQWPPAHKPEVQVDEAEHSRPSERAYGYGTHAPCALHHVSQ